MCNNMDRPGGMMLSKKARQEQMPCVFTYLWSLKIEADEQI